MRMVKKAFVVALAAMLLVPGPALAGQQQVLGPDGLAKVASEHAAKKQADRQMILDVLKRDEVRQVAQQMGVSVAQAERAVQTLDGRELTEVASQARQVQDALSGGQAITISVWLIIIILLVIILVAVA